MTNETLFYICGIGLAVSAVLFSFVGLKVKSFPGKAFPLVILWFAVLVGGAATFSVLHAQDEEQHKEAEFEHANEEFEAAAEEEPGSEAAAQEEEEGKSESESPQGEAGAAPAAKGPGGTLKLAADPSAIAYDATELDSKPGKVTIDFSNPATLEHDVAIEAEGGEELAASETIAQGETTVSAELAPGTYTFFCTVPGHREAGMEGTLTVK
jgi:plastocyanin